MVKVRHTSSAEFTTTTTTTLSIGGVDGTFSPTTRNPDTTADAFTLTDQANVTVNTLVTSNPITVVGIEATVAISVTAGEYSIDEGAFTKLASSVSNGQVVKVRHTASTLFESIATTTLSIGEVEGNFTSTTGSIGIGFNQALGFNDNVYTISPATDGSNDVVCGEL